MPYYGVEQLAVQSSQGSKTEIPNTSSKFTDNIEGTCLPVPNNQLGNNLGMQA